MESDSYLTELIETQCENAALSYKIEELQARVDNIVDNIKYIAFLASNVPMNYEPQRRELYAALTAASKL